jgi:hypothetical protein
VIGLLDVLLVIFGAFLLLAVLKVGPKKLLFFASRPVDTLRLGYYLLFLSKAKLPPNLNADEQWCYFILTKVSRSFSAVIIELNIELKNAICIFYLVLRALDTIGTCTRARAERDSLLCRRRYGDRCAAQGS